MAFPGVNYQIEVYHPTPAQGGQAIAAVRQVTPVG